MSRSPRKVHQIGAFYLATISCTGAGLLISIISTRLLSPQEYGDLKFLQNLLAFFAPFFSVGLFVSGARLIAQKREIVLQKNLMGGLILWAGGLSLLFGLCMYSIAEVQLATGKNPLLWGALRNVSPLVFIIVLQLCIEKILEGDNRIFTLSFSRAGPPAVCFLLMLLYVRLYPLTVPVALSLYLISQILVIMGILWTIAPRYKAALTTSKTLWAENKRYGIHVYLGYLSGVTTAQLGGLLVAFFLDTTHVGWFQLAVAVASPLGIIPIGVAVSSYKDFVSSAGLPRKTTILMVLLAGAGLLVFWLCTKQLITLLYPPSFQAIVPLVYFTSGGAFLVGLGDYVNRFLGAHGLGVCNRNAAIVVGVANILFYVVSIPLFGLIGAAVTRVVTGGIYLALMLYYYHRDIVRGRHDQGIRIQKRSI